MRRVRQAQATIGPQRPGELLQRASAAPAHQLGRGRRLERRAAELEDRECALPLAGAVMRVGVAKHHPGAGLAEAMTGRVLQFDGPSGVLRGGVTMAIREGDLDRRHVGLTFEHPVSERVADL
jgi:hypothetical protein